ncbi:MAG: HEAT repeat domain-containing protein, partial [Polyangiales bacterium]
MQRRQSLTAHADRAVRGLDPSERVRLASRLAVETRPESRELAAVVLRHVDPADSAAWSRAGHLAWQLVHDSAVEVRREAAISFACLAEDATTAVSELRHDDRPGVRLAVTLALGEARGEAEVQALLALLRDENV